MTSFCAILRVLKKFGAQFAYTVDGEERMAKNQKGSFTIFGTLVITKFLTFI